ncbi:MAG: aspartyl/asparaginyl beta-hydroxylase domain-containing protein [Candidatus Kapaibacterium sp.]
MLLYSKLPLVFNVHEMQNDVFRLEQQLWQKHYNAQNFEGSWTVIPLYSLGGKAESILSVHAENAANLHYEPTVYLQQCPYLLEVIQSFQFPLQSVRLMKLNAGSIIKEHMDYQLSFEEGEVRLHIPIITNDNVEFYVQDERIIMNEGECWYLNLSLRHRVSNNGKTDRVHLVIDGKVNDWLRAMLNTSVITQTTTVKNEQFDKETIQKIIQELLQQGTQTAIDLADKLRTQL